MRSLLSVSAMIRAEQKTMNLRGLSSFDLMQEIAKECAVALQKFYPQKKFMIFCGPGNNGGDGYSICRFLRINGATAKAVATEAPGTADCRRASTPSKRWILSVEKACTLLKGADWIVVDCIFGLNGRSTLPDGTASILKEWKKLKAKVVAIDLPTGVDAKNWRVSKLTPVCDRTLSVGYVKDCFIEEEIAASFGKISVVGSRFASANSLFQLIEPAADFLLPPRARNSFKGQHGHCGVFGERGAVLLAAEAAARMGAGYASIFSTQALPFSKISQASFLIQKTWKDRDFKKLTSFVVGCGGKPKKWKWSSVTSPAVVDASSLSESSILDLKNWKSHKSDLLLTPHPGEAAKILKTTSREVQSSRLQALEDLCEKTGQSIYLKGAPGLLKLRHSQTTYISPLVNPVFASAGSGDILSGILGGLLAQYPKQFKEMCISGFAFQAALGELMGEGEGRFSGDQLSFFPKAFEWIRSSPK